jgi:molybdopterin/thiamine biosynthesis adenylyltransferase
MAFSPVFARQLAMPEIGERGQARLQAATALIAGVGGLGSAVASYLAAAGIGRLILVDCDRVEESNLNRQLLYGAGDLGASKVHRAKAALSARCHLRSELSVEALEHRIADDVHPKLQAALQQADIIVDGLDSFSGRLSLCRLAKRLGHQTPIVHGAAAGFEGRVATIIVGKTPCLGCLFSGVPNPVDVPIVGATAGLVGCAQAIDVIKWLLADSDSARDALSGVLLQLDAWRWSFHRVRLSFRKDCPVCKGAT